MRMRWFAEVVCFSVTWISLLASSAFLDQPKGGHVYLLVPSAADAVGQVSPAKTGESKLDPAMVVRGESAFMVSCTSCHDAQRTLQNNKSFSGWMATVRRMANKDDAAIAQADIEPIATYLTSLGRAEDATKNDGPSDGVEVNLSRRICQKLVIMPSGLAESEVMSAVSESIRG